MEKESIYLPLEYWDKRKEFLKELRSWLVYGKVRMVKNKSYCRIVFYYQDNLCYIINACINFGAWLKNEGYRTYHNKMIYPTTSIHFKSTHTVMNNIGNE